MNDELRAKVQEVIDAVNGSCDDIYQRFDDAIEEGEIDKEEFRANEHSIFCMVDDQIFCCNSCNWNFPVSEMSEENDWCCTDCDD